MSGQLTFSRRPLGQNASMGSRSSGNTSLTCPQGWPGLHRLPRDSSLLLSSHFLSPETAHFEATRPQIKCFLPPGNMLSFSLDCPQIRDTLPLSSFCQSPSFLSLSWDSHSLGHLASSRVFLARHLTSPLPVLRPHHPYGLDCLFCTLKSSEGFFVALRYFLGSEHTLNFSRAAVEDSFLLSRGGTHMFS